VNSPLAAQLARLHLDDNRLGNDGIKALAGARTMARLVELTLTRNNLTAEGTGLQALARSRALPNLASLSVQGNPVSAETRQLLAQRFSGVG
jgi:hypothetical protein